jgi:hypothetical protein
MKLLRTDGTSEDLGSVYNREVARKHIGPDMTFAFLSDGRCLIVDDLGYAKELPRNAAASAAYNETARPGSTPYDILGDVILCEKGEVT